MPGKSRKIGKQVKKRGISNEQVCIATAIDRQGNLIMELLCKGRMTHRELERLYDSRIGNNSILCTDSHKSYVQFSHDFSLDHIGLMVLQLNISVTICTSSNGLNYLKMIKKQKSKEHYGSI